VLFGTVGAVVVDPTAASAHANIVTGVATCSKFGGNVDITWTVANDYDLTETATVTSATGGTGTVTGSPATIAASPGEPYQTATMYQVLRDRRRGRPTSP
jgi:hypothetical protein